MNLQVKAICKRSLLGYKHASKTVGGYYVINGPSVKVTKQFATVVKTDTDQDTVYDDIKPFEAIPQPKGYPIVGTLFEFTGENRNYIHKINRNRFLKLGPIYREALLGLDLVYISKPDDVKALVASEGTYPRRPSILFQKLMDARKHSNIPLGLFLGDGEDWHRFRKVMNKKMMRPKEVRTYTSRLSPISEEFVNKLYKIRNDEGIIENMENEIYQWSTESIATVLFEKRLGLFDDPPNVEAQHFHRAVVKMLESCFLLTFSFPHQFIKKKKWWQELIKHSDVLFEYTLKNIRDKIQQISDNSNSKNDSNEESAEFLTFVLKTNKLSMNEINSNIIDLFMAGVDTTASAGQWMMYNLGKFPEVQDKVRNEINNVFQPGDTLTADKIEKMPLVRGCIRETARLYPATPSVPRIVQKDTVMSGYRIPAGTSVTISPYTMGQDQELYNDPYSFKPERWQRGSEEIAGGFKYTPFGVGPRMCIGKRVSELELQTLLVHLLSRFTIEVKNEVENRQMARMTLYPEDPMLIKLTTRSD